MRAFTLAVLVSTLAGATAAAQSMNPPGRNVPPPSQVRPPTTNGMSTVPEAPIGHRQPTPRDLPPSLRRDEDSNGPRGRAPDPFSDVPNICNGC